jgi:hypothetical protein
MATSLSWNRITDRRRPAGDPPHPRPGVVSSVGGRSSPRIVVQKTGSRLASAFDDAPPDATSWPARPGGETRTIAARRLPAGSSRGGGLLDASAPRASGQNPAAPGRVGDGRGRPSLGILSKFVRENCPSVPEALRPSRSFASSLLMTRFPPSSRARPPLRGFLPGSSDRLSDSSPGNTGQPAPALQGFPIFRIKPADRRDVSSRWSVEGQPRTHPVAGRIRSGGMPRAARARPRGR